MGLFDNLTPNNNEENRDKATIDDTVKRMFEANDLSEDGVWPDNFDELDSAEFTRLIGKYADNNNKLSTNAYSNAFYANSLLDKFSEAFPVITGEETINALNSLDISLDYGVMGNDLFIPKIMPCGSLLIRNFHRLISLSYSPELNLKFNPKEMRVEFEKVLNSVHFDGSMESQLTFLIIHRDLNGQVIATQELPESFSSVGQTLILVGNDLDLSASSILSQAGLDEVQSGSRLGVAVLRFFRNCCLVYSTERFDDCLDTAYEEYASIRIDELDASQNLEIIHSSDRELFNFIQKRTDEFVNETNLIKPHGLAHYFLDYTLRSYRSEKLHQLTSLLDIFGPSPKKPQSYIYSNSNDKLWYLSEEFDHYFAKISLPVNLFNSIEEFSSNFDKKIHYFLKAGEFPDSKILLLTDYLELANVNDLAEIESPSSKEWIEQKSTELKRWWESWDSGDISEFMSSQDLEIPICLVFKLKYKIHKLPDHVELNQCMRKATEVLDLCASLSVPHIGFEQGYDSGDYDTGNSTALLTTEELGD